jgi:hypothetical protein
MRPPAELCVICGRPGELVDGDCAPCRLAVAEGQRKALAEALDQFFRDQQTKLLVDQRSRDLQTEVAATLRALGYPKEKAS